jgi:hypothetical protein
MCGKDKPQSVGNDYGCKSPAHVGLKLAIFVRICFVIQITIHTFAGTEKLVILASRFQYSSDPEEDLKVKS